jgi:tetratricopeptide (TPR) repeat protein
MGTIFSLEGDQAKALEAYAIAFAFFKDLAAQACSKGASPQDWAIAHNDLAMTMKYIGDLKKDAEFLENAKEVSLKALDKKPDDKSFQDTYRQIESALEALAVKIRL